MEPPMTEAPHLANLPADLPDLAPDCARCAALCCFALAFDEGEDFGLDKPAGLPCPNLDASLSCTLHDRLEEAGFAGCARFDCQGAGQRVTQEVFAGQSWREEPALAAPMIEAFAAMRQVHEGLELLWLTRPLDLPEDLAREREALIRAHMPPGPPPEPWSAEALARFMAQGWPARRTAFLRGLRDFV